MEIRYMKVFTSSSDGAQEVFVIVQYPGTLIRRSSPILNYPTFLKYFMFSSISIPQTYLPNYTYLCKSLSFLIFLLNTLVFWDTTLPNRFI